jgi:Tol biopolymer transport system component
VLRTIHIYYVSRDGSPLLRWTPDGKELVFTTQLEGTDAAPAFALHALSLDTGRSRVLELGQLPDSYDTTPAFTASGDRIAFVRYRAGVRYGSLMTGELGPGLALKNPPRLVPLPTSGSIHSLFWAPDGQSLVLVNGARILQGDLNGRWKTLLTAATPPASMSMQWRQSGGGHAIVAMSSGNADIMSVPLEPTTHLITGPPTPLAQSTSYEAHPTFSPDGRKLAFISARSGRRALWLAEPDGTKPRQIADLDVAYSGFPRWSPDGSRIVFHTAKGSATERMIYVVNVAAGVPQLVGAGCCPEGWSHDGRSIYVTDLTGGLDTVARMDVSTGHRDRLFPGVQAVESVDGKLLLYAKVSESGVFARSLAGDVQANPEVRLVPDYRPPHGSPLPVADGFYYVSHTPHGVPRAFRFYDFSTGIARDLGPAPASVGLGLTVSPDEHALLYSATPGDSASDLASLEFPPAD